jgi:chromatin structure-remodeling complex subunit RSC9
MLLSLRSGIPSEIAWAFDRLCRLCNNEQFLFRSIPGLTNTLFEWPEWYVTQNASHLPGLSSLFAIPPAEERKRRHGLEALCIMRNAAAVNESNAEELVNHKKAIPLILSALNGVQPTSDDNVEFLLYVSDLFQYIAPTYTLPSASVPQTTSPLPPLLDLIRCTSNRSLIISSLTCLHLLFSNPANASRLTANSPALSTSLLYLPLLSDKVLVDVCLNYLYVHLSHPPMAKAFLLHLDMPSVLKLLVTQMLSEQIEDTVSIDIGGPIHTAPAQAVLIKDHELSKEELDGLIALPEPQRCYEWYAKRRSMSPVFTGKFFRMKLMFVAKPEGELTQVDFWNLYKDVFVPFQDQFHLLVASDVIKNVNVVFPQAQAMVLPGPPQKFVVRGVDRRKDDRSNERFKCLWDRSGCDLPPCGSASELYEHVLEHISSVEDDGQSCLWATCSRNPLPKSHLRAHVLTHLPSAQPLSKHPTQSDTITLPSPQYSHPVPNPTTRPLPPQKTTLLMKKAIVDPPSSSLTALLCIRIIFRTAFTSIEAAPRADADHFGFPGVIEEDEGTNVLEDGDLSDSEQEGQRRGRRAFVGVRKLLEGVQIRDEALMSWITEMIQATVS